LQLKNCAPLDMGLGNIHERSEGRQGEHNSPHAEPLWGTPKSPNNVTRSFFSAVHLLPKDLRFKHGGTKLASWPGRHLPSLRPLVTLYLLLLHLSLGLVEGY